MSPAGLDGASIRLGLGGGGSADLLRLPAIGGGAADSADEGCAASRGRAGARGERGAKWPRSPSRRRVAGRRGGACAEAPEGGGPGRGS